jgi:hypothetical protein
MFRAKGYLRFVRTLSLLVLLLASVPFWGQQLEFAVDVRSTDAQLRGREVLDVAVGPDGLWWLATQDEGVLRYDGVTLLRAQWPKVPPIVLGVAPVRQGAFAATSDGLFWIPLEGQATPVAGMKATVVDVDAHGDTLWVLQTDGLWMRVGTASLTKQAMEGLLGATQFGRRGSSWWVASTKGLWVRGASGFWTRVLDQPVRSAAVDGGGVWAETESGLERLTDEGWERATRSLTDAQWIPALDKDSWWVASREGLFWVDDEVQPMAALGGTPLDLAVALAPDGNGGLLLAGRDGMVRIPRPEQWYDVRTAAYNVGRITSVARTAPDCFAVLSSAGLQLVRPEGRTTIPLPSSGVPKGLAELTDGRWLLYGEFGALEWQGGSWRTRRSDWVLSAGWSGATPVLETTEGWLAWDGAALTDIVPPQPKPLTRNQWPEEGYAWNWGERGLFVKSSARGVAPLGHPRWVLRSWEVQDSRQGANVVLRVARLGDPQAEGRALRYRLDAGDWVDLGAGRSLVLSGLSSGTHVFELESVPVQRFTLFLPRPWWAQPRFWVPVVLGLALAASLLGVFVVRRRREAKRWAREKGELERMALRLQMNPHFTFNALESISSFVMEQKPREAVQYLNRFARLMRYTLEKAEQERVPLSDELEALAHYVVLEQMRFDQSFDHVLEVDESLEPADLAIPPMLLQPLVENAILHGLRPLANRRGRLTIRVLHAVEPNRLRIEVEDNGIGRHAASVQRTGDEGQKRSMATRILERRLKALTEATGSPFVLDVADLDEGTRVVLALPNDEVWGA